MIKTDPNLKSHFSYQTGVSLLLPADWKEVERQGFAASYLSTTEQNPSPSLGIQVFPGGEVTQGYRQVAQMMLDMPLPEFKLLYRAESTVDRYPAIIFTASWRDKASGRPIVQHVAVIQVDSYIFPIIGLVTPEQGDKYLKIINEAMRSIRFISMVDED
ncbi:MAG: hypothetical protein J0I20_23540 [Chloroflexi bacterium]|nr:hypothetical protein [Chloroflexota bacterium]OJW04160.1 MAG: hypothetical protein BGO39_06690 [Chloroflexi bacterium 54-19]